MGRGGTAKFKSIFSSTFSSTYTSPWQLVADAATISVSWSTVNTSSSLFTIQGSNDEGTQSAITNASTVTAITSQGIYTIDPGIRWLRFQRHSLESLATANLNYYTT